MKTISKWVLTAVALGSAAVAGAQPYGPADQERRERNREEAIANYERMQHRDGTMQHRDGTVREDMREGASTVEQKTHRAAQKTRSFTHRQLDKVRNFGERQQRKIGPAPHPSGERSAVPAGEKQRPARDGQMAQPTK